MGDKYTHVDCNTLATETTRTTDSMDVVFTICWKIVAAAEAYDM